jgi:kynureninase
MDIAAQRLDCVALDAADPLGAFRARFALPPGLIYLNGNSLGPLPIDTAPRLAALVEREWGQDLVRGWNVHGWVDLPQRLGERIGRLIGAAPGETIVADSTSVNLFKVLAMALRLRPDRRVILTERSNFPADLYIAEGLADWLGAGHELRLVESSEVADAIDRYTAVVTLSHVNYRDGRMHDLRRITERAHTAGALTAWDLAHSAGAVPLQLAADGADFAVGCGYKFLNGGPGAPAFLYVAGRHQEQVRSPLSGWFGHLRPFSFEPGYLPAAGVSRALAGTPPILGMTALQVGVDLMLEAEPAQLRVKSQAQAELFITLYDRYLAQHGFDLITPRQAAQRGSQICITHPEGWPIMSALHRRGVIGDFRAPDVLRFGLCPLYLGYAEVWDAVAALKEIMRSEEWRRPEYQQAVKVT